MTPTHHRSEDGFTMLEVIVAIVLFTVVATSTAFIVNNSIQTSSLSQLRVSASAIAQEQLSALRSEATVSAGSQTVSGLGHGGVFTAAITVEPCGSGYTQPVHVAVSRSTDGRFLARTDSVLTC